MAHSLLVDSEYLLVGAHVDDATKRKIENSEYIDFAKLLIKDKQEGLDDNRMVMVHNNGDTYWTPYSDWVSQNAVSSYQVWSTTFRVFSDIYTRRFPSKATELIQYNHIIYTASLTFPWVNVYKYDKDFRIHMAKYPTRNWGIILQTSWNLRLVTRAQGETNHLSNNPGSKGNAGKSKREICYRYNSGRCSYGLTCKFDHQCAVCSKYGHGAYNCRKLSFGRSDSKQTDKAGGSQSKPHGPGGKQPH